MKVFIGSALLMPNIVLPARFWTKVRTTDSCWEWQGATQVGGYGSFHYEGRTVTTHRLSWRAHFGEIPDSLWVLHKCDNARCVNPKHLFLGTNTDNVHDMFEKGRNPSRIGELCGRAKLTEADVLFLRSLHLDHADMKLIAEEWGLSLSTIRHAVAGTNWKHLL